MVVEKLYFFAAALRPWQPAGYPLHYFLVLLLGYYFLVLLLGDYFLVLLLGDYFLVLLLGDYFLVLRPPGAEEISEVCFQVLCALSETSAS